MSKQFLKLKEIIHYIISKCSDQEKLGAVKLNKILFYSDLEFLQKFQRTISGQKYFKQVRGPVCVNIPKAQKKLVEENKILIDNYQGTIYTLLKGFKNSKLITGEEKKVLDKHIKDITENYTAKSISEKSHVFAWEYASHMQEIPIGAFLVTSVDDPSQETIKWAKEAIK